MEIFEHQNGTNNIVKTQTIIVGMTQIKIMKCYTNQLKVSTFLNYVKWSRFRRILSKPHLFLHLNPEKNKLSVRSAKSGWDWFLEESITLT